MPAVLFVCTANVNRSPMASRLFMRLIAAEPDAAAWKVESAGTWALEDEPAAQKAQIVLQEEGLDLSEHRARTVSSHLLRAFSLILTMERGQKEAIKAEFPEIAERVYLLSEMAGYSYDISDPVGGSLVDFRDTARELKELIEKGDQRICQLARQNDLRSF